MVTARGEEVDRVLGLETGADDYLAKPYSPRERLACIRAQVRRARGRADPSSQPIQAGKLSLDLQSLRATLEGKVLPLTTSVPNAALRFRPPAPPEGGRPGVRGGAEGQ